jgi:hypothetical protein
LKVHASVHCNPVKPSRKRRFVAEGADVLKDLQENLLGQIFRIISVACEPVSEPKDRVTVNAKDLLKRLDIAALTCPNQSSVNFLHRFHLNFARKYRHKKARGITGQLERFASNAVYL